MGHIKAQLLGQKHAKKQNRDFSINTQHLILLRSNVLLESNIMQSNIYTSKIIKQSKLKQDTGEKVLKEAYKGKSWKRGTDKRSMNFDSVQGA